jgi:hypothetical protein
MNYLIQETLTGRVRKVELLRNARNGWMVRDLETHQVIELDDTEFEIV